MMRVQGGKRGLLAALDAGIVDPLSGNTFDEEYRRTSMTPSERRKHRKAAKRRNRANAKRQAAARRAPY